MASWSYVSGIQAAQTISAGDNGFLGRNATINSTSSSAILASGGSGTRVDLLLAGQVVSQTGAGVFVNFTNLHLDVAATGLLMGISGVSGQLSGSGWISNAGEMIGVYAGVNLTAGNSGTIAMIGNTGRIAGGTLGLNLDLNTAGNVATVTNSGEIDGGSYGVTTNQTAIAGWTGALKLINSGIISGGTEALHLGASVDSVVNSGVINGIANLGAGSDRFDNRLGTVNGTILGGAGNDSFRPGQSEEVFNGEGNTDTVDFRGASASVLVDLSGVLTNTGVAMGDAYLNVENLLGTNGGDRFYGTDAANNLRGLGGDDRISARGGDDALQGGVGKDSLWGGAGNDDFLFYRLDELGDAIADFGSVAGNDDQIWLSASGLGGGLVAGALSAAQFVTRASDHAAQDTNDRLILTTSNKTLWFDADGSGTKAAVLVADLQQSATLTAADIWLV